VVNIVTSKVGWYTVAYVPSIAAKHEPMSKPKAAQARAELLQRTIGLVFYRCMLASHCGAEMRLRDGTKVIVSPRVLLFVCDQPEERAVLGLKRHGSTYDCTPCMARSNASSNVGDKRPPTFEPAPRQCRRRCRDGRRAVLWRAQKGEHVGRAHRRGGGLKKSAAGPQASAWSGYLIGHGSFLPVVWDLWRGGGRPCTPSLGVAGLLWGRGGATTQCSPRPRHPG